MKLELLLSFIYLSCINALLAAHPSCNLTNDRVTLPTGPTKRILRLNLIATAKQRQPDLNAKAGNEVIYGGKNLLIKL
jgi:hypothetical protein